MEKETVIEIKDLKIDYRNLNHFSIQQIIKNPAFKGRGVIHAIRGVDLTVKEGEILGIIGANGAGKSTLLKAISGIFRPDGGSIKTNGKRVSLMSLGVGFKWELSGRDNIMIAGLLLHYPASYIKAKTQEIIDFSGLGADIDRPVRTYSSGMYSKLGFAITAILETDIMLVDELLSVGDENFQAKSFEKMQSLVENEKTTALIVSHDMELLRNICSRVIWMDKGRIVAAGDPGHVIDMYVKWSQEMGAEELSLHDDFRLSPPEKILSKTAMFRGLDVNEKSGKLINAKERPGFDILGSAVNWEPVFIPEGSRISSEQEDFLYRIFAYKKDINDVYIYIPCTSTEGNRLSFDAESSVFAWQDKEVFEAPHDMYVRIALMHRSGHAFPADMFLEDMIQIESGEPLLPEEIRTLYLKETEQAGERVREKTEENDAVIIVISDCHFSFGGNWQDTAFCLKSISQTVHPLAIVNLGDLTDGRYPEVVDRKVISKILKDMEQSGPPVYICPGNHDLHRLPGGDKKVSPEEFAGLTGRHSEGCYYKDLEEILVRMIFLNSYDGQRIPEYGFSDDDIKWTEQILEDMPSGYGAILFSHVNPYESRTKWDEEIKNSEKMLKLLDRFSEQKKGCILAMICGHDHEDRIRTGHAYPVISMGCSLLEDHSSTRPLYDGKFTRRAGEVSQELFDVLIVKKDKARLELVRFGAGEDRHAEVK